MIDGMPAHHPDISPRVDPGLEDRPLDGETGIPGEKDPPSLPVQERHQPAIISEAVFVPVRDMQDFKPDSVAHRIAPAHLRPEESAAMPRGLLEKVPISRASRPRRGQKALPNPALAQKGQGPADMGPVGMSQEERVW